MSLSDTKIRNLKPGKTRQRLMVDTQKGRGVGRLLLDVHPSGRKVFLFRCIQNGQRRFIPLGDYAPANGQGKGTLTLAEARKQALDYSALLQTHGDLRAHLEAERLREDAEKRKAELKRGEQGTFGQLLEAYVDKLNREGKASARQTETVFRRHVRDATPDLIDRRAKEITPVDIHRILAKVHAADCTRQVNKARSMLMAAFNYAATAAYDPRRPEGAAAFGLDTNPVALTKRISEFERARDRVLSAEELSAYWRHLDQVGNSVVRGFLTVALLLGGQRIAQLDRLRASDINTESDILQLRDSKGRNGTSRLHLLPLTQRVKEALAAIPRIDGTDGWIFSMNGRSPLRPETISAKVAEYSVWLETNANVKPFQARDLRRTCETRLAELGLSKDIRAQLLSHGISGVQAKHYDRHSYLPEKREALERWEEYLDGLVDPARKVVPLPTRHWRG